MNVKGGLSNAQLQYTETPASGVFGGTNLPIPNQRLQAYYQPGTAVDQMDGLAVMVINLVASTPQTINLLTGLTDVLGNALTVERINFLAVKNLSTTDGQIVLVGDAAADPFTGIVSSGTATIPVYPSSPGNDGFTCFDAPNATGMVVSSGSCNLKLDPGANAITVVLVVVTRSV